MPITLTRNIQLPFVGTLAIAVLAGSSGLAAQTDTSVRVQFGAFVDVYYAHDFGRPRTLDRAFTTQAARHSEFNVNLAHLDARVTAERLRGRLAVQTGTSVQANYAAEPQVGAVSGPDVARLIQEATIGYRVAPLLWVDAGVFFAPFGSESWLSSDNWTYTRSLIADNSPYYQSGVKATWLGNGGFMAQVHVINGWQNISETNSDKAFAVRFDWSLAPQLALAYDAFLGNEQPDTAPSAFRVFHEVTSRLRLTDRFEVAGTLDYGTQQRSATRPEGAWRGWAVLGRFQVARSAWVAVRAESYSDPHQIIVVTGSLPGLRARGGSLNLDIAPQQAVLWRLELRGLASHDAPFPDRASASGLASRNWAIISSLALRAN